MQQLNIAQSITLRMIQIYSTINSSLKQLQKHLNIDLKQLYKWLLANKTSLNCAKTEVIFFHKPGHPIKDYKFNIKINGHKIYPSEFIKYLGICRDTTLSGKHHCELLSIKLKRS